MGVDIATGVVEDTEEEDITQEVAREEAIIQGVATEEVITQGVVTMEEATTQEVVTKGVMAGIPMVEDSVVDKVTPKLVQMRRATTPILGSDRLTLDSQHPQPLPLLKLVETVSESRKIRS